jgi:hypothetical protein
MWSRQMRRTSAALAFTMVAAGAWAAVAQHEAPGQLHTIRTPGTHRVRGGDMMQVRYKTNSASNGIRTLEVELSGDSVRRVSVVAADIDPDRPGPPGASYFVIAFLKAEMRGPTMIRITPITNEGNRLTPFEFKADVQDEF